VWSIGVIVLTGGTEVRGEKHVPVPLVHHKSHMHWPWYRVSHGGKAAEVKERIELCLYSPFVPLCLQGGQRVLEDAKVALFAEMRRPSFKQNGRCVCACVRAYILM
jgi:hypothetical protein